MALRIPPGRAGRTWLIRRIDTGRRGADLLDRKREVLMRAQPAVRARLAQARRTFRDAAAEADAWSERAAVLDGPGRLELLARHAGAHATVAWSWSNVMGARLPAVERIDVPRAPALSALGASSATVLAARACEAAVAAAVLLAAAERADAELTAELTRAGQRLRALRERWIPEHERALAQLDLALDEAQREQSVRIRWLTRRVGTGDLRDHRSDEPRA